MFLLITLFVDNLGYPTSPEHDERIDDRTYNTHIKNVLAEMDEFFKDFKDKDKK